MTAVIRVRRRRIADPPQVAGAKPRVLAQTVSGALVKPRPGKGAAHARAHGVDLAQGQGPPGPGLRDPVGRLVHQIIVEVTKLAPDDLGDLRGGRFRG